MHPIVPISLFSNNTLSELCEWLAKGVLPARPEDTFTARRQSENARVTLATIAARTDALQVLSVFQLLAGLET